MISGDHLTFDGALIYSVPSKVLVQPNCSHSLFYILLHPPIRSPVPYSLPLHCYLLAIGLIQLPHLPEFDVPSTFEQFLMKLFVTNPKLSILKILLTKCELSKFLHELPFMNFEL